MDSATIKIGEADRTVVFDYARLEAIEVETGRTVNDIVFGELASYRPDDKGQADATAVLRRMSVALISRFVAGALGVKRDELAAIVPPKQLMAVFMQLVPVFCRAVILLNGGEDASAALPPEASASSGPGPASNSG